MIKAEDWIEIGQPVNESERQALATLRKILETTPERYAVVSNVRLPNGRGDFYEFDAIVVAPTMLFALEFKGWGGRIVCQRDRWYLEDGSYFENPSDRISRKAKTLGALLTGRQRALKDRLWVQDLVYVNGPGAKLTDVDYELRTTFDVIPTAFDTVAGFRSALLTPERWTRKEPLGDENIRAILNYLRGGEKRIVAERLGKYVIDERLVATSERFERLLVHDRYEDATPQNRLELHVYPLDGRRGDVERIARTFRRQIGIAKALGNLGVAPRFVDENEGDWHGKLARYIAFEWLGRFETLGDKIARTGEVGLRDALRLAIALADALSVMHGQGIVHGALEPSSIYLKPTGSDQVPDVLIGRIELARPREAGMSVESISTAGVAASCYASPDVLANRHPDESDDIFSFGAMLVHLLRGRPLFASPNEVLQQLRIPKLLDDRSADPVDLRKLVTALLARNVAERPSSMREVATELRELLRPLEDVRVDPQRIGNYRIVRELRAGATGRTVVAVRDDLDGEIVLKIAPLGRDETLRREIERLRTLHHPNIVIAYTGQAIDHQGVFVGEFALIEGDDCERLRGAPLGDRLSSLAQGLFAALSFTHQHGLVHRDVKPANVMLSVDGVATLLDFGLAALEGDHDLVIGTAPYKPESLFERGAWARSDDVFAAIVTLWETVTGRHPWGGEAPQGPPSIDAGDLGAILDAPRAKAFADVVRDLLVATPDGPNAAEVAASRIGAVLKPAPGSLPLPLPPPIIEIPSDASLRDSISRVALNKRARQALDDLGIETLEGVRSLRVADLSRLKGFGRGVSEEILAFAQALVSRFGEPEQQAASVLPPVELTLAPVLSNDTIAAADQIDVLGLSASACDSLRALGIFTVAALGASEGRKLAAVAELGESGVAALRQKLREYVDDREGLVVDAALPPWRLAQRANFVDEVARLGADASRAIDILEVAGGFELTPSDLPVLACTIVAAPPWTHTGAAEVMQSLSDCITWPPQSIDDVVIAVSERVRNLSIEALAAFPSDLMRLLVERSLPLFVDVAVTSDERWYRRSECDASQALRYGTDGMALPAEVSRLLRSVEQRLPGIRLPSPGTAAFDQAVDAAGLAWLEDGRIDRKDAIPVETARAASDLSGAEIVRLTSAAESIVRASASGGYRLVVAEPGVYASRVASLVHELQSHFGTRLHVIDFDSEMCRALEENGTLATALRVQSLRGPVPGAIAPLADGIARSIMERALNGGGGCTLIINTGSLGLTNASQHLGKIYELARGGRHGLVVVCVPGDHPREHARLNRTVPLPQQPTERPIALEEVA